MRTISKRNTHISTIRGANQAQITQICAMLGWDKQAYCDHQFAVYLDLVELIWPRTETKVGMFMQKNHSFCSFFINEWIRRNKYFLKFADEYLSDCLNLNLTGVAIGIDIALNNGKFVVRCIGETFESINLINDPMVGDCYLAEEYDRLHRPMRMFCDEGFEKRLNYLTTQILTK